MTDDRNDDEEPDVTTTDAETLSSHTPSSHKVIGELSETDASGVLGRNTSSSGTTYGVVGETESSDRGAAAVLANAPNGATGLRTTSSGYFAVDADTTGHTAIKADTDGQSFNAIHGENSATTGWSWGVRGDTHSTADKAYGVRGFANATSGSPKGVGGTTSGEEDGAAGVYGEATADSGDTFGVDGVTSSSDSGAAGVRGSTTGDNHGVEGRVYDDESNLPTLASFESAGVFGRTDKTDGWGVVGWSRNDHGVFARTDDPGSYAVYGFNSDPDGSAIYSSGNLEVNGCVDVSQTGLSAYLSLNQTIDDDTTTTVVFDATNADHFNGYDTSTGQYTIQEDGDYHVSFTIDWQTNFDAGVNIGYELQINEDFDGGIQADTTTATSGQRVCRCFSRTLFGLSQGDTLEVAVEQDSGSTADIWGSNQESYLTLYKVG